MPHALRRSAVLAIAIVLLTAPGATAALAAAQSQMSKLSPEVQQRIRELKRVQWQMSMNERFGEQHEGVENDPEAERDFAPRLPWESWLPWQSASGGGLRQRNDPPSAEDRADRMAASAHGRLAAPLSTTSYGANVFANDPSLDDPNHADTQSEPGVAMLGNNIVVAWNDYRGAPNRPAAISSPIAYAYSTNGGQSFTQGGVPPFDASNIGSWTSDPVLTVNEKTGEFYFCALFDTSDFDHGLAVAHGHFAAGTFLWSPPARVIRSLPGSLDIDKPWIAADSLTGNLYVSYTRYYGAVDDSILFTRSTNGGNTWSPATALSSGAASGYVQGSRPAVGPDGEVYVTWKEIGQGEVLDYMRIRKSTDGGATFGPEQTAASFIDNFGTGAPGFNRSQGVTLPSIAVDRTTGPRRGHVYVAWNETVNFYDAALDTTPVVFESEPNDSSVTATHFVPGDALRGSFNNGNDFDYFGFDAVQGTTYVFWSDIITTQYTLRVLGTDGVARLAFSGDRRNSPPSQGFIVWTCPESGTYYVRIVTYLGGLGPYRILTSVDVPGGQYQRARDQRDAFVASSSDGVTWSLPVLIHPNESPWFDDWLPEIAVASPGSLYSLWYDFSDGPPGRNAALSSTYMARSDDGGATWSSLGPVSDQLGDWTNSNSELEPNQGDYLGLFASANSVLPVWADPRLRNPDVIAAPFPLNQLQVYIEGATIDTSHVVLRWGTRGTAPASVNVYRAVAGQSYDLIGSATFDGLGYTYDDTGIAPGTQYRYALGVNLGAGEQIVGERTVIVPGAPIPALSFTALHPNPSSGTVVASFVVPDSRPADLVLYDLSGRQIRKITVHGAGPHDINLGQGIHLESGLYFVRLSHGDTGITRRLSVVR